ncbi:MAG TPA: ATP-binding cassette domain-containing protein [Acidimicrobiales bacterium]|jgi:branched-chain amino acid transport system ATP-binding protein|nr:ATP-binding cassette domain-containing protein [Acidimicrobiales bacterium]
MSARLECRELTGGRGATVVFRDLELDVQAGTVLALLGPNGAGKSTLLLTLAGLLPARAGNVAIDGARLRNGNAVAASRAGVVLVPDNRSLFTTLSVEENLDVARRRNSPAPRELLDVFPALEKRWHLAAGALSGGEQQMLAMARALIQQPKVLLVDEMSMGLAPLVVETLFDTVRHIASDHGAAIVLVEQHVSLALGVADEAAVLNRGTVVLRGAADELRHDGQRIERAYFGDVDPAPAGSPG